MTSLNRYMAAAVLATTALASACSSVVKEPEVRLDNIGIGSIGLDGGTLRVRLNVVNPNSFGLQADGLSYLIEVAEDAEDGEAWDTLSVGSYEERITIEADDSAFVEIPVRFRYRDLGTAITSLISSGTFDYRISGRVRMREPMRREFPFHRTGNISELTD